MSLKVLHVIPSVSPQRGGPSKAVLQMVAALKQTDVHAEIATTNDNGVDLLDVPLDTLTERQGAPIRYFERWSPAIPELREFQYSSSFVNWLKQHIKDYDLLHVHAIFSFCSSYAMWLARRTNVPYVVRPIGQLEPWSLQQSQFKKALYLRTVERNNLRQAAAIHFTAISEQENAANVPSGTGRVIPLGVEQSMPIRDAGVKLRQRYKLAQAAPVIVFLGRLHEKKGLEILLDALARNEEGWQLLIAGDGDPAYVQRIQAKIDTHNLTEQVQLVGFVEGAEKNLLLQGADLFALTSQSENFGIAVLEALNVGTPVLLSDAVALAPEIERYKLGFVTRLDIDQIETTIASALQAIEEDRFESSQIQQYVAQHYRWDAIAEQLKLAYADIIERHAK